MSKEMAKLTEVAGKLGIGSYQRHVFLCIGDQCCSSEVGSAAWEALKAELKERGLSPGTPDRSCYRTKVGCLRACQSGPLAVVYPEGTYYANLTADRVPEFVQKHLVDGTPIKEWIFARNPLSVEE
ncbi:(2Fe-2S) ferredoxin domain-containing protein [Fimbriiglobus ruber]|uniref:Ferredoxin, 2Fe-2S n=1 Tax=Fimbriiglobus ruber TaxID=1908690 RepID=A0A225DD97_9BACT|nr:(2Fe-2S) ferredoxin domain-containing protein [Fimbriiglobus ruber]OWK35129.1 Ferredoxin, 2Fe-2S [Fimbriiglobus ruber]